MSLQITNNNTTENMNGKLKTYVESISASNLSMV